MAVFTISATVNEQDISLDFNGSKLVSGSKDIYQIQFTFSESWDSYTKKVVFENPTPKRAVIEILLTGTNICTIPIRSLANPTFLRVGIYGVGTNDEVMPTVWSDKFPICEGTYQGYENPPAPDPDVYDEILAAMAGKADSSIVNSIKSSIAPTYSTSRIYGVGQVVQYNNAVYRCIKAGATGSFDSTYWVSETLGASSGMAFLKAQANMNGVNANSLNQLANWTDGYYVTQSAGTVVDITAPSSHESFMCALIPVNPGDNITMDVGATGGNQRIYAFYKSTGEVVSRSGTSLSGKRTVTAPANAAFCGINCYKRYAGAYAYLDKGDLSDFTNCIAMFTSMGICGASWESGDYYANSSASSTVDRNRSWGAVLGRKLGVETSIYALPSAVTAQTGSTSGQGYPWQNDTTYGLPKLLSDDPHKFYWLNFLRNDQTKRGASYLGTIADIKSDYTQNPDTYYGNFGRIIEQIQAHAPNAKFLLGYRSAAGDPDGYEAALHEIGQHYGIPVIDWNADPWCANWLNNHLVSNHPTLAEYAAMADAATRLFARAFAENVTYYNEWVG